MSGPCVRRVLRTPVVAGPVRLAAPGDAPAEDDRRHDEELAAAYRAGVADGRREALEAGTAAVPTLIAELRALADDVALSAARQVAADARDLIDTALEVARWVLGAELRIATDPVVDRLREALSHVDPDAVRVRVHLHPAVAADVRSRLTGLEVVDDPSLEAPELRVEADASSVRLDLDDALATARDMLLAGAGGPGGPDGDGMTPDSGEVASGPDGAGSTGGGRP